MNLPSWLIQALPPALLLILAGLVVRLVVMEVSRRRLLKVLRAEWGSGNPDRLRQLQLISEWHRNQLAPGPSDEVIDDRTWDDLHLDAIFAHFDHTRSRIGQQYLYDQLRRTLSPSERANFQAQVDRFGRDADCREATQLILSKLDEPVIWELWRLTLPDAVPVNRWFVLVPFFPPAIVGAIIVGAFWTPVLIALLPILFSALALRTSLGWRLAAVVEPFRRMGTFFDVAESFGQLDGAEFVDGKVEAEQALHGLRKLRKRIWLVGRGGGSDPVSVGLDYFNLILLLDLNALRHAAKDLVAQRDAIDTLFRRIGSIDAAQSLASWRAGGASCTTPIFVDANQPALLTALRHPLVPTPVAQSIALAPPHGVLVTGSNMSGKSTFLRNVGVAAVMAQALNVVLADGYSAPIYRIRSCIGRGDDLLGGKSYYLVEVERVLAMVQAAQSDQPHLLLFDELFRGTNTVERIAAGEAVLREMLSADPGASSPHLVIAATHDGELVDLLAGVYAPWHFGEDADADGLTFTYQLMPGPATSRNAITLLRLHGASERLLRVATARAATLDAARLTRGLSHD